MAKLDLFQNPLKGTVANRRGSPEKGGSKFLRILRE